MVRNSSRIRNRFHRDGELRSGPGVGRRLADGTSCSWLNLDLASSRCRVLSSLMIWRARILVGSGAGVVLYRTGLAMDQSRAAAVRGGSAGGLLSVGGLGQPGSRFLDGSGSLIGWSCLNWDLCVS